MRAESQCLKGLSMGTRHDVGDADVPDVPLFFSPISLANKNVAELLCAMLRRLNDCFYTTIESTF